MADILGAVKQLAFSETYVAADGSIKVSDSFPVTPSFGAVWYRMLDLGFPNVRDSMQENPSADGVFDETQFTGARAVVLEGVVVGNAFGDYPTRFGWPSDVQWNSASWFVSLLSAWANPARRFRLYWTDEIGRSRFMDVRGAAFTAPFEKLSDSRRDFQLQLVCPSGKIYAFAPGSEDGRYTEQIALTGVEEEGRAYPEPAPYNRNYPAGIGGKKGIVYGGTVPNGVVIKIYTGSGTMQSPRVTFTSPTGIMSSIGLGPALDVAPETTIIFDTINRTVTTQADSEPSPSNVAYHLVAPLVWPRLLPGINNSTTANTEERQRGFNKVVFTAVSPSADATVHVLYHEADLQ